MTAREIRAQLSEAIRSDRRAAAILKKIAAGRANFSDTMDYSLICGRLTGSQLAEAVLELSEDREELAEALLHDRYEDINARCAEVQTALDDKQGLHLAPQKADFPAERAAKFAHSLLDPTVTDETIKRRARSVSENITVTFHDDFIRENAAFRDRAGLKCYVERTTSGGCCDWCSNVAGRYLMQEQPEGLFRRHDNCDCTIVYDGQVLRGQSGVNGRRGRRWVEEKPKAEYTPPKRFSHDEAEKLQAELLPKRLTGGGNGGIIEVGGKYVVGTKQWFKQQDLRAKQATSAYQDIFNADNIKAIADSSGLSEEDVQIIKNHVFAKKHIMYDGTLDRFTPDYDMAVAFKRLEQGKPEKRDILLLKHELYESQCEEKYHLTASEAHAMATQKYDWQSVIESLNDGDGELDDLL